MRSIRPPQSGGQWVVAEDRLGQRWDIECLGEPLDVGARIAFEALSPEASRRGVLARLLDTAREAWVCSLRRERGGITLSPFAGLEMPDLALSEKDARGVEDGARVVVVPTGRKASGGRERRRRSRSRGGASGLPVRVAEILGPPGDPDADHRAVAWKHRLPSQFSRRARLEVEAIEPTLPVREFERRLDLRRLPFVTIDPASARDHDDAVFAEPRPPEPVAGVDNASGPRTNGARSGASWTHRLWVAIADVSHFVVAGGFVDAEARRRANSVYFPDRAIPMLPERLSSDLCSLRPGEDRPAMVVELRVGEDGDVLDALFHEAVVRSRARLSYEEAADWLETRRGAGVDAPEDVGPAEAGPGTEVEWGASLRCLAEIAEVLSRLRARAGAIALELPEIELVLDEQGVPVDAIVRERNRAHLLIEEAMLAANRAVAGALVRAGCEALHRVHPPPDPNRLAALAELLGRLGGREGVDLAEPGALSRALEAVRGQPSQERLHIATLRAMSQARYASESRGHYALHFDHYVHFTSPIRRYADLEVHRALKGLIRGAVPSGGTGSEANERLAIWLSGRERVAMEAERDAEALACCALMRGREGERFEARVTGATEYGLFVRLDAPAVSGLVPMRLLEGQWIHDPEEEELIGARSGARIGLGDAIGVRLVEVDADRGRLSFGWVRGRGRHDSSQRSQSSASSRAASSSERRSQSR